MEKFRAYRQVINDDDDWEFAVPWAQVHSALAAKGAAFDSCNRARRAAEEEVDRLRGELRKEQIAADTFENQLAEARRALEAYETPEGVAMLMERQGWKRGEILAHLALLYCAADASRMNGERAVDLMRDAISKAEKAMPLAMTEAQAREEGA